MKLLSSILNKFRSKRPSTAIGQHVEIDEQNITEVRSQEAELIIDVVEQQHELISFSNNEDLKSEGIDIKISAVKEGELIALDKQETQSIKKKPFSNLFKFNLSKKNAENANLHSKEQDILPDSPAGAGESTKVTLVTLPNKVIIGYQRGTSLSDLKTFVFSKTSELMNKSMSNYNIIKMDGGYYWEVQEGGCGSSALPQVIEKLRLSNVAYVKTSSRTLKIVRDKTGNSITSYLLNEEDSYDKFDFAGFNGKMKPVLNKGFGFMVFGMVMFVFSLIAVGSSSFYKHVILNKEVLPKVISADDVALPLYEIKKISDVMASGDSYIDNVTYNSLTNKYLIKKVTEETTAESTGESPTSQNTTDSNTNKNKPNSSDNSLPSEAISELQN